MGRKITWFLCLATSLVIGLNIAKAQTAAPKDYVIGLYLHENVKDQTFLSSLICMLENTFNYPVKLHTNVKMNYEHAYVPERKQYKGELIHQKLNAFRAKGGFQPNEIVFFFIEDDMYYRKEDNSRDYNFLFSKLDLKTAVTTIAMDRLRWPGSSPEERTYKTITRFVTFLSGYMQSKGCILAHANGLMALDAKPDTFCDIDLRNLKTLGIVRQNLERDTNLRACDIIASRDPEPSPHSSS